MPRWLPHEAEDPVLDGLFAPYHLVVLIGGVRAVGVLPVHPPCVQFCLHQAASLITVPRDHPDRGWPTSDGTVTDRMGPAAVVAGAGLSGRTRCITHAWAALGRIGPRLLKADSSQPGAVSRAAALGQRCPAAMRASARHPLTDARVGARRRGHAVRRAGAAARRRLITPSGRAAAARACR